MSLVRLARRQDLDALVELASTVDRSMTTVPRSIQAMAERLDEAEEAAAPGRRIDGSEAYLFVLEEDGRLLGLSAVYAAVGVHRPFYSYKVSSISQASPDLGVRVDTRILHLVNDYAGASVVGTLYLHPEARGGGRGRLLSLARFVFMAAHRERFGDRVMAEMRGLTEADGSSPFWDAVGKRFFQREFSEADLRRGHEFRYIAELFPTYPIYADLLPSTAQNVIGRTHPDAEAAVTLLTEQGLRDHGYVDIFDAGLCLHAFIDDLQIVRACRSTAVVEQAVVEQAVVEQAVVEQAVVDQMAVQQGEPMLVADPSLDTFAVVNAPTRSIAGGIALDPQVLDETGWEHGRRLLVAPSRTRRFERVHTTSERSTDHV